MQPSRRLHAEFSANAEIAARLPKLNITDSIDYEWRQHCNPLICETPNTSNMTLKIEKCCEGDCTTIRLVGRMRAEHLAELETQMKENRSKITLDLEEVNLVDLEVVRFLGACEAQGVTLLNCSPYISDWIAKERG